MSFLRLEIGLEKYIEKQKGITQNAESLTIIGGDDPALWAGRPFPSQATGTFNYGFNKILAFSAFYGIFAL